MKLYLAGPMRGIPYLNSPAFRLAADQLRAKGHEVYSPVEDDEREYGVDLTLHAPDGDELYLEKHGFSLREAFGRSMTYICLHAEGIALLPGWQNSKGATAEYATAKALGLVVLEL
jgi:hypothetical protein